MKAKSVKGNNKQRKSGKSGGMLLFGASKDKWHRASKMSQGGNKGKSGRNKRKASIVL